jgi:hypothetical protein
MRQPNLWIGNSFFKYYRDVTSYNKDQMRHVIFQIYVKAVRFWLLMVANIKAMVPWDLTLYSTGTIILDKTVASIIRTEISSILTTEQQQLLSNIGICMTHYHAPEHLNLII